jgi:hypothetical protein
VTHHNNVTNNGDGKKSCRKHNKNHIPKKENENTKIIEDKIEKNQSW